jgi:Ca-activated chloride channel family protein
MDLRFADPILLSLLLLLPALAWYAWRGRRATAIAFGALAGGGKPAATWRVRGERALPALRLLAAALLVIAIARPQRGEATSQTQGEGIDIVLAFDISSSMSQPFARTKTRLQAATDVLSQFVAARTNDRVGLVAFQGASITLSPLTTDYNALGGMVRTAGRITLSDGTAIGLAIGESVNLLRSSTAASRVVILLTDGENNVHDIEPGEAAKIAESLGVRVYTIGVVTPPAFENFRTQVGVDEQSLKQIAETTGGTYNRAEDPQALQQIYENIDELEKSRFEDKTVMRFDEMAPYVLAAAAAALALEFALRYGLFRRAA